jgi:hypothetical protein
MPTTELPFAVVLYAALLLFLAALAKRERGGYLFLAAGFTIGIGMLIRPIAIGAGIVMGAFILAGTIKKIGAKIMLCSLLIAGNFIAVAPWEAFAYSQMHKVIPLCNSRASVSTFDGLTFAVLNHEGSRKGVSVPGDVRDFMIRIAAWNNSGSIDNKDFNKFLVSEIRQRPLTFAKLVAIKAARSWYGTNSNRNEKFLLLVQLVFVTLLLYSLQRLWRKRRESRLIITVMVVFIAYFWFMTILVLSIVRYMTPILGVAAIFLPALWKESGVRRQEKT